MVKNIVILGAGFAGLAAAQSLQKGLQNSNHKIILIDESDTHLYRADLYEVATAFNKKVTQECLTRLKETVATPLKQLVNTAKINFLCDKVLDIDAKTQTIKLQKNKSLKYEYLIVTLGSTTNFFKIPGLEKHSFPLKTMKDGLKINCHLDQYFQNTRKNAAAKNPVHITIGGGGATGVELAGELTKLATLLSKKYNFPRQKIFIQIIEGTNKLAALNEKGTKIIKSRLEKRGVKIYFNHYITKVTEKEIFLKKSTTTKKIPSNILVWTGGVQVNPVVKKSLGSANFKGAIAVNRFLQSKKHPNLFAAGDNAYFPNPENPAQRLPMLANIAVDQGKIIAKNILNLIRHHELAPYKYQKAPYIIPVCGRYAILSSGRKIYRGRFLWYFRRLLALNYSLSILPLAKAFRKWNHGTKIFLEND